MLATLQNQPISFSLGCVLAHLVGFLQIALRFDWLPDCLYFWSSYVTGMWLSDEGILSVFASIKNHKYGYSIT